jgi:invasion protein IalB
VKISLKLATLAAILALASTGTGHAQASKSKTAPPAAQAAPPAAEAPAPPPGWSARCSSASRDAPMECAMEQQAVQSKTGQLVALINIRVPSDTHTPIVTVQLPLGLNLPGGTKFQVDDGKVVDLQIQTCEQRGCFAGGPIAPDFLASLRSGKLLKLSFQNLAKETITIPMPLADFAAAYDKIK